MGVRSTTKRNPSVVPGNLVDHQDGMCYALVSLVSCYKASHSPMKVLTKGLMSPMLATC